MGSLLGPRLYLSLCVGEFKDAKSGQTNVSSDGRIEFFTVRFDSLVSAETVFFGQGQRADVMQLHPPQRSLSDQQDWGSDSSSKYKQVFRTQACVVFDFMVRGRKKLVKCIGFCCDIDKIYPLRQGQGCKTKLKWHTLPHMS